MNTLKFEDEHESPLEQARRRAPTGGFIPGQEIPFTIPCEKRYRKSSDTFGMWIVVIAVLLFAGFIAFYVAGWRPW